MRIRPLCGLVVALLLASAAGCHEAGPAGPHRTTDIRLAADATAVEGTIAPGETFGDLLERHGVDPDDRQAFTDTVEPVFSSRQLRAHQGYAISVDEAGRLRELTYKIDAVHFLLI